MTDQADYDGESRIPESTSARFAHLFPWSEFCDKLLSSSQLVQKLRPNKAHQTLRDMKPIWFSADALRNIAPPGEVVISSDEELKIRVIGEVRDYLSANWDGFVESDLVFGGAIPEALFQFLHFAWLDRDPTLIWPPPPVAYIAQIYERFRTSANTDEPQ